MVRSMLYAEELGFPKEEVQLMMGTRDPKEFGKSCPDCHTGFKDESCLGEHLKSCAKKKNREAAAAGKLTHICAQCGNG